MSRLLLTTAICWTVVGCTSLNVNPQSRTGDSGSGGGGGGGPTFAEFSDLPVPTGAKIDLDKTLVLGSDDSWIGRLVLDSSRPVTDLYDFYKREMPRFGWTEVTVVRASISILVFQLNNRVATIKLQTSSIRGSSVDVTVSPRGVPEKS